MFRFSIRELMLLTLVVALGLGWWLHYRRVDAHRQAIIQHAERLRNALVVARKSNLELEDQVERVWSGGSGLFVNIAPDWSVLNEKVPEFQFYEPPAIEFDCSR